MARAPPGRVRDRMNPYQVLGVAPTASMDQIEAAYRHLLRAYHPDLHQTGPPEEIAHAEAMTVALNDAMARIRAGQRSPAGDATWAWDGPGGATGAATDGGTGAPGAAWSGPSWGPGGYAGAGAGFGFDAGPDTDWFGNPLDPRARIEPIACPLCGLGFRDPVVYRSHLAYEHGIGSQPSTAAAGSAPRRRSVGDLFAWLGWIPAPSFWLFVVLVMYWAIVVAVLGESIGSILGVWIGVVWYVVFLRLAYKYRRRSA